MQSVLFEQLIFEREDLEKINAIRQMYSEIKQVVLSTPAIVSAFKRNGWKLEKGLLKLLKVSEVYSEPAFENLYFAFEPGLNAEAKAQLDSNGRMYVVFRLPRFKPELEPQGYNQWFIQEVRKVFEKTGTESVFVHEFIHLLDIVRVGDPFYDMVDKSLSVEDEYDLVNAKRNRYVKALKDLDPGSPEYKKLNRAYAKFYPKWLEVRKRFWTTYINTPAESNAYFNQAIASAKAKAETIAKTKGVQAALKFLGTTPQEFVSSVEGELKKLTGDLDFLDPKTMRGIQKRAAVIHDSLVKDFIASRQMGLVQNNGDKTNATD
jgi:hypothetical protein